MKNWILSDPSIVTQIDPITLNSKSLKVPLLAYSDPTQISIGQVININYGTYYVFTMEYLLPANLPGQMRVDLSLHEYTENGDGPIYGPALDFYDDNNNLVNVITSDFGGAWLNRWIRNLSRPGLNTPPIFLVDNQIEPLAPLKCIMKLRFYVHPEDEPLIVPGQYYLIDKLQLSKGEQQLPYQPNPKDYFYSENVFNSIDGIYIQDFKLSKNSNTVINSEGSYYLRFPWELDPSQVIGTGINELNVVGYKPGNVVVPGVNYALSSWHKLGEMTWIKLDTGAIDYANIEYFKVSCVTQKMAVINGSMLVDGSITAEKVEAAAINGTHISATSDIVISDKIRLTGEAGAYEQELISNAVSKARPIRFFIGDIDDPDNANFAINDLGEFRVGSKANAQLYMDNGILYSNGTPVATISKYNSETTRDSDVFSLGAYQSTLTYAIYSYVKPDNAAHSLNAGNYIYKLDNIQVAATINTEPSWIESLGAKIVDTNGNTWENIGTMLYNGSNAIKFNTGTSYNKLDVIIPSTTTITLPATTVLCHQYRLNEIALAKSATEPVTWNQVVGGTCTDGNGNTWLNKGTSVLDSYPYMHGRHYISLQYLINQLPAKINNNINVYLGKNFVASDSTNINVGQNLTSPHHYSSTPSVTISDKTGSGKITISQYLPNSNGYTHITGFSSLSGNGTEAIKVNNVRCELVIGKCVLESGNIDNQSIPSYTVNCITITNSSLVLDSVLFGQPILTPYSLSPVSYPPSYAVLVYDNFSTVVFKKCYDYKTVYSPSGNSGMVYRALQVYGSANSIFVDFSGATYGFSNSGIVFAPANTGINFITNGLVESA